MRTARAGWNRRGMLASVLFVTIALSIVSRVCYSWGNEGHATVAAVAALGLTKDAKAQIRALLGAKSGQESARMQRVASWADDVRGWHKSWAKVRENNAAALLDDPKVEVPTDLKAASQAHEKLLAHDFILALVEQHRAAGDKDPVKQALDDQSGRHFTNVPLGTKSYREAVTGTGDHDCVHSIERCVAVLNGSPMADEVMNKEQAIRFLIHYVGDLHQPLHAGVAYWIPTSTSNRQAMMTEPDKARDGVNDLGGNSLTFKGGKPNLDLHKFWDGTIVSAARQSAVQRAAKAHKKSKTPFVDYLRKLIKEPTPWRLEGVLEDEVEAWDSDTVVQSSTVYTPLNISMLEVVGSAPHLKLRGDISVDDTYVGKGNQDLVSRQLSMGGMRLAMIINSIWP